MSATKASNVNAANYLPLASRFMAEHATGKELGVMIARETTRTRNGTIVQGNETQWRQWMEYFRRKQIPHQEVEHRGYLLVPAMWPEEFDSDIVGGVVLPFGKV